jgi:hypothetical protein
VENGNFCPIAAKERQKVITLWEILAKEQLLPKKIILYHLPSGPSPPGVRDQSYKVWARLLFCPFLADMGQESPFSAEPLIYVHFSFTLMGSFFRLSQPF